MLARRQAEEARVIRPLSQPTVVDAEPGRERETGGVGLGLAIVRSVAEWHGGAAHVGASPLGGARVSISW